MFKTYTQTSIIQICTLAAFLAPSILRAQESRTLEGVWDVNVTVTNCHGTVVRTVHSVQLFHRDHSLTETSNLSSRGISEGVWKGSPNGTYDATFWFFRYPPPAGPFASFATANETITLDSDDHFTASGTVEDDQGSGTTMTSCFTHTATRLASLEDSTRGRR